MKLTDQQALAFVGCLNKGPAKVWLEAHLGAGELSAVKEFYSQDPDMLDRCSGLAECLISVGTQLQDIVDHAPQQQTFAFDKEEDEDEPVGGVVEDEPAEEPTRGRRSKGKKRGRPKGKRKP